MALQRFIILSLSFGAAQSASVAPLQAYDPNTPHTWNAVPAAMFAKAAKMDVLGTQENVVSGEVETQNVFPVIFILYGSLALCWLIFSRLPDQGSNQTAKVVLLCVSWCSCSVGMHTLNKSLSISLGTPSLIALSQMLVAVIIFGTMSWKDVVGADRKQLLVWMIVPMFFASMLISSFYTYTYISLSLLTIIRNLTPLVVLPIETVMMPAEKQPHVNLTIIGAILIMFVGALIYGGTISDISWIGVLFAVLNMVIACSDRLIQRRLLTGECKGLTSSTCSILNNGVAMVPTFAIAMMTQEVSTVTAPENVAKWTDPSTMILLVISGLVGMGICYFGFECQRVLSATSFFVMQNMSKLAVVCVGVTVFGDQVNSAFAALGLVLSLGGSGLYGYAQMEAGKATSGEAQKLVAGKV